MERLSIFKYLDLPPAFGATLLTLMLVLWLVPFLPTGDFGVLKIPPVDDNVKTQLKRWVPLFVLLAISLFIPAIPNANAVKLTNPFGKQQILLDGNSILITSDEFSSNASGNSADQLQYPKQLFYISKPTKDSGFGFEMTSTKKYAEALSERVTGSGEVAAMYTSLMEAIISDPIIGSAEVFRVYRSTPLLLEFDANSRMGPLASAEQMREAIEEAAEGVGRQFKALAKGLETTLGKSLDEEMSDPKSTEEFAKKLFGASLAEKDLKSRRQVYSELSMVIVDRSRFEKRRLAINAGRLTETSPLQFLLSTGGRLPNFDLDSVKQASISSDNRVWGFYGRTQWQNIKVNGTLHDAVYYDFYRIYVMNSSYIYQITLSYIPSADQPRDTWEELVRMLRSLRISTQ